VQDSPEGIHQHGGKFPLDVRRGGEEIILAARVCWVR